MRSLLMVPAALIGTAWLQTAAAQGETTVAYSADYVLETAEGAMRGRIYATPGMERREDLTPDGGTMVSIRREDKDLLWMLIPAERMYMEIKTGEMAAGSERTPSPEEYQTEMTTEGREEVGGVMTTKSKVIMTAADGSKMGGFWWTTDEGVLIKMDVLSVAAGEKIRMKRELTNVQLGSQPADLFEIPAGYVSMSAAIGGSLLGLGSRGNADESGAAEGEPAEGDQKKRRIGIGGALRGVLGGR